MFQYVLLLLCVLQIQGENSIQPKKGDFLIVQHPKVLVLLNNYEQILENNEREKLLTNMAFRIVTDNTILGDGVTVVMSTIVGSKQYYILKKNKNSFRTTADVGKYSIYRSCFLIDDTCLVVLPSKVRMIHGVSSVKRIDIEQGDTIVRVFKKENEYYSLVLKQFGVFGWLSIESDRALKVVHRKKNQIERQVDEIGKAHTLISKRFSEINIIFKKTADYFTTKTKKPVHTPNWECRRQSDILICSLENQEFGSLLTESRQYVFRDIQALVIGMNLQVVNKEDGSIIISQNLK